MWIQIQVVYECALEISSLNYEVDELIVKPLYS